MTISGAGSEFLSGSGFVVGFRGTGAVTIENGGELSSSDGAIGFHPASTASVSVYDVGLKWTINSGLNVGGNNIIAGGTGDLTVENGGLVEVGGLLRIWDMGTVTINGGTLRLDILEIEPGGSLTFNFGTLNFTSDLPIAPDDSLQAPLGGTHTLSLGQQLKVDGTTTLNKILTIGSGTFSTMELAGTTPGTEHDQMNIASTLTLGGTLDLRPIDAYTDPATHGQADTLTLMTAGARSGQFDAVLYDQVALDADFGPDANGSFRDHVGGGLFRNLTYTGTSVVFRNLNAATGDTDGDKDVDITDFNTLATNFDPTGNNAGTNDWITADFGTDGDIDITDFNSLATNFAPTGYGATSPIPEPSSVMLLVLGLVAAATGALFRLRT